MKVKLTFDPVWKNMVHCVWMFCISPSGLTQICDYPWIKPRSEDTPPLCTPTRSLPPTRGPKQWILDFDHGSKNSGLQVQLTSCWSDQIWIAHLMLVAFSLLWPPFIVSTELRYLQSNKKRNNTCPMFFCLFLPFYSFLSFFCFCHIHTVITCWAQQTS